jgi:hypothetical protein
MVQPAQRPALHGLIQKNFDGLLGQLTGIPGVYGHRATGTWYFAQNKTEHGQGY